MGQTAKRILRVIAVAVAFAFIGVNKAPAQTGQNPRNNPDPALALETPGFPLQSVLSGQALRSSSQKASTLYLPDV